MEKINKLKKLLTDYNLDGYIVPKNDEFFTEYSKINRLKLISNFTGSAGLAIILNSWCYKNGYYVNSSFCRSSNFNRNRF